MPNNDVASREAAYVAIGKFIVAFSQLEFIIRHTLAEVLDTKHFDEVTSPYDFATLCRVTEALIKAAPDCDKATAREVGNLFRECLRLNDQRNRLVHGTWSFGEEDPTTLTARHVSRQTLTAKDYFTTVAEIEVVINQAEDLRRRVVMFLIGTPATWHLFKRDDPS